MNQKFNSIRTDACKKLLPKQNKKYTEKVIMTRISTWTKYTAGGSFFPYGGLLKSSVWVSQTPTSFVTRPQNKDQEDH